MQAISGIRGQNQHCQDWNNTLLNNKVLHLCSFLEYPEIELNLYGDLLLFGCAGTRFDFLQQNLTMSKASS
ncbi:MAG TPA: hypothetical protein PKD32_09880 [Saprospiraceae bacterium]|nr:hypothetical protein [Saprospiraceae bacterium]